MLGRFFLGLALAFMALSAQAAEKRLALVMANQDYPDSIGRLSNTHNDAATVERALKAIGFQVNKLLDADAAGMEDAITAFELAIDREAADGDKVVAFVYASMHGAATEVDGRSRNFLLPAREEIATPGQLIRKGVRMDELIQSLSATQADAVLIVSDACRNELRQSFSKSTTKGWLPERAGTGVLVAFATPAGSTTPDDGLFAQVLAQELQEAGRKASFAMLEAVEEVAKRRSFDGQPVLTSGGLPDWLCFAGCDAAQPDQEAFLALMAGGGSADSCQGYQDFLAAYPASVFRDRVNVLLQLPPCAPPSSGQSSLQGGADSSEAAKKAFNEGLAAFNTKDFSTAAARYKSACDGGNASACANLGHLYQTGQGVAKDNAEASRYYKSACDEGVAGACTNLGGLYQYGNGVAQDHKAARGYYQKGCDSGHVRGCANSGYMLQYGLGGEQDFTAAASLYARACEGDDGSGCANLGYLYQNGLGVAQNMAKAAELYGKACEAGTAGGCGNLGSLYRQGEGVPLDYAEAIRLSTLGCERGSGRACAGLGWMSEQGMGGPKDFTAAAQFYRTACDLGDPYGCTNLGILHLNGTGVEQNRNRAQELFRTGCDGGIETACANLSQ